MKKFVMTFVAVCFVALAGVGIYFSIPKPNNAVADLSLNFSDFTVVENQSTPIEYEVPKNVVIQFRIQDTSVAKIRFENENYHIFGVKAGSTKLEITKSCGGNLRQQIVNVFVVKKDGEVPKDDENPNGEENKQPEFDFCLIPEIGCNFLDGKLVVQSGELALFSVQCEQDLQDFGVVGVNCEVEREYYFFKLTAFENCQIKIVKDSQILATFDVVVQNSL